MLIKRKRFELAARFASRATALLSAPSALTRFVNDSLEKFRKVLLFPDRHYQFGL